MRDRTMRSQLVGAVLAAVRAGGGDPAALIARFELPPTAMTDAEVTLPLTKFRALLDAAAEAAGDPALGVHVAQTLPRGAYGVVEYSCRSAPTIREALVRLVRYFGLLNELVTVSFDERGGEGVVEQRVDGEARALGRHANELFVVTLLERARQLTPGSDSGGAGRRPAWGRRGSPAPEPLIVPTRAWFAHAEPDDVAPLIEAIGTRAVRFDAGRNGFALPCAVLDLPLASADAPLSSLLDRTAEQALAGRAGPSRFLGDVRARVREMLGETPPSLTSLAAALKMSARTLQRRLGEEGVSFQTVVDDVRREQAIEWVGDARRPLGEIAYLLGYAELRPFLRAFKRWTGQTPAQARGAVARDVT
jgi:AraC-like DNA-binding protein